MTARMVGQTVLVTGATSGIGCATAARFAASGARVVLVGRRAERLAELAATFGERVHGLVLDVRDHDGVMTALAELPEAFRNIDVLVNNAGLALGLASLETINFDDCTRMLETNCAAVLSMTRAVLPAMRERNRGHIVHMGSIASHVAYPGGNVYCATKAFVHQLSQSMKADLAGTGVRVTCIEPGMVETEFSEVRFGGDKEKAASVYRGMKALTPEDVAEAVFWCVSLPAHVNVNLIELMPTAQGFGPTIVKRVDR